VISIDATLAKMSKCPNVTPGTEFCAAVDSSGATKMSICDAWVGGRQVFRLTNAFYGIDSDWDKAEAGGV